MIVRGMYFKDEAEYQTYARDLLGAWYDYTKERDGIRAARLSIPSSKQDS